MYIYTSFILFIFLCVCQLPTSKTITHFAQSDILTFQLLLMHTIDPLQSCPLYLATVAIPHIRVQPAQCGFQLVHAYYSSMLLLYYDVRLGLHSNACVLLVPKCACAFMYILV